MEEIEMVGSGRLAAAILMTLSLAGAGPMSASPVQAQLSFGFGFDYDDEDDNFVFPRLCILTDRGLRDAIEDAGYENVSLNVANGDYVQARARRGDWVYLLRVNACTGEILDRERLRRASTGNEGRNG
jgi:hypothetical protein